MVNTSEQINNIWCIQKNQTWILGVSAMLEELAISASNFLN